MTNDFDNENEHGEFVEHELTDQEKPQGVGGNLAEAWRTRPLFKLMVLIIAVFAVAVAGFSFLGGKDSTNAITLAKPPANLHEAPGGVVSPYMKQQTELANSERSNQAIATGGSALPTPIGQSTDVGNFGNNAPKDDPLNELRAETERLKKEVQDNKVQQQVQQQQIQQQVQQRPPEQFDNSLAEAMQRQMQQLLEGWTPKGIKQVEVIKAADLKAEQDKALQAANAANAAGSLSSQTPAPKPVVPAGTVSYAQLLTEANSDVPGPILAQVVSGPLAGARVIGGFKVADGYEKYLVLSFSLADKKGKEYQLNAIALDPNTTLGGMATEVDERYFARVVLPAAAGFLQGMGQALGQGNSSITTDGTTTISQTTSNGFRQGVYTGMGQAANTAGEFFQNQANLTKPLVRVASGTPIGLFFVGPVFDPDTLNGATPPLGYANAGVNGYPVNTQTPYPGTTIPGYGNSAVQQNMANGVPYPNYAAPAAGYNGLGGGGYNGYNSNPVVQQNIANGLPYPNYAAPASGYTNLGSSVRTGYPGSQ